MDGALCEQGYAERASAALHAAKGDVIQRGYMVPTLVQQWNKSAICRPSALMNSGCNLLNGSMRSSFAARRKPRRVGQDDEDDRGGDVQLQESPNDEQGKSYSVA